MVFGDPIEEKSKPRGNTAAAYCAPQPKKTERKKINLSCNLHFCCDNCDFKFYDLCSDAVLREQFESALTTYVHIYPAPYYYYILFTKVWVMKKWTIPYWIVIVSSQMLTAKNAIRKTVFKECWSCSQNFHSDFRYTQTKTATLWAKEMKISFCSLDVVRL